MDKNWVIARQPDTAIPVIGQEYEIRDSRKGTFTGKILSVNGEWADVEVTDGKPKFISLDYKLGYNGYVSIRAGLVYLIAVESANTASSGLPVGSGQAPVKVAKSKTIKPAVSR